MDGLEAGYRDGFFGELYPENTQHWPSAYKEGYIDSYGVGINDRANYLLEEELQKISARGFEDGLKDQGYHGLEYTDETERSYYDQGYASGFEESQKQVTQPEEDEDHLLEEELQKISARGFEDGLKDQGYHGLEYTDETERSYYDQGYASGFEESQKQVTQPEEDEDHLLEEELQKISARGFEDGLKDQGYHGLEYTDETERSYYDQGYASGFEESQKQVTQPEEDEDHLLEEELQKISARGFEDGLKDQGYHGLEYTDETERSYYDQGYASGFEESQKQVTQPEEDEDHLLEEELQKISARGFEDGLKDQGYHGLEYTDETERSYYDQGYASGFEESQKQVTQPEEDEDHLLEEELQKISARGFEDGLKDQGYHGLEYTDETERSYYDQGYASGFEESQKQRLNGYRESLGFLEGQNVEEGEGGEAGAPLNQNSLKIDYFGSSEVYGNFSSYSEARSYGWSAGYKDGYEGRDSKEDQLRLASWKFSDDYSDGYSDGYAQGKAAKNQSGKSLEGEGIVSGLYLGEKELEGGGSIIVGADR
ncbi:hypothetical protein [Streptococcus equi]|uniref:hypothetical protein n=1 Tax=Streptococcus equi TaxID=1336 RepID=UPI001E36D08A|nr:hypothetical protein [Streptococcus equi]MCD3441004.1 hypothetical protein [Streptococcus equi subsp. zooepidemicus]